MRPIAPLAVLAALTAFGCAEAPTDPGFELETAFARGGPLHQVRGSGHLERGGVTRTFAFTAQLAADGTAKGSWVLSFKLPILGSEHPTLTRQQVEVTCLSVSGDRAWVAGVIRKSTIPGSEGLQTGFSVLDGGEGSGSGDAVSLQGTGSANPDFAELYCSTQPDVPMLPVEGGNVQVD